LGSTADGAVQCSGCFVCLANADDLLAKNSAYQLIET
jgi:hypothetical protein